MVSDKQEVKEAAETAAVAVGSATAGLQTRVILRVVVIILAVAAALFALYQLQGVILLLVLSIFFAYLVAPLVDFVRRPIYIRGREFVMPRGVAIGIVYLALFGSLGLALYLLLPRLGDQFPVFASRAQQYLANLEGSSERLNEFYKRYHIPEEVSKSIQDTLKNTVKAAGKYTTSEGLIGAVGALSYLPWLILIPILAFFLLKDAESFRASALQMLPRGRWRWRGDEFFQDVNSTLAAYIRAQLTACLIVGIICTIGFEIIGTPSPLVLGLIAGLLEFIPLAGPLLVALLAIVLSGFSSLTTALTVFLFLVVLRIVEDYVIYPRIIGQGIHLHPLAVILAILCGAELAGIAGVFLAIPVIAIITVSYRHWLEHRGSEGLVADLLKPVEQVATAPVSTTPESLAPAPLTQQQQEAQPSHPTGATTPEQMTRARPDLTTGELKLRTED
ncbi:MAG TPA: AI-2E family transporter [Pyrinomonadaceae bacterium]|jgi:predicted PurR-regulated permease PerM|nr:AI-2E family transporter [Pyrinomonadaceae bacterium]